MISTIMVPVRYLFVELLLLLFLFYWYVAILESLYSFFKNKKRKEKNQNTMVIVFIWKIFLTLTWILKKTFKTGEIYPSIKNYTYFTNNRYWYHYLCNNLHLKNHFFTLIGVLKKRSKRVKYIHPSKTTLILRIIGTDTGTVVIIFTWKFMFGSHIYILKKFKTGEIYFDSLYCNGTMLRYLSNSESCKFWLSYKYLNKNKFWTGEKYRYSFV